MTALKNVIFVIILAVASRYVYLFLAFHGVGVHHNNHYPGKCRLVGIECGSEQIRVTVDGLAFITNGIKGGNMLCDISTVQGKIYLFDFNRPEGNAVELQIEAEDNSFDLKTFSPHGMDIYDDGKTVKLYVVSHVDDMDTVERFEFKRSEPLKLRHIKTIRDEKFVCLNDLTVVREDEFYATNWRKTCRLPLFLFIIELYLQLPTANIVHYKDGEMTKIVATGPGFNGVTLSNDKSQLLAASFNTAYVYVFDVQENATLAFKIKIFTGNFPDNLYTDVTARGEVYYAGVLKSLHQLSSGSAIKITTADRDWKDVSIEEVFHDDGVKLVKGVSAAVHYKGHYLFGTVFHKLAYCVRE